MTDLPLNTLVSSRTWGPLATACAHLEYQHHNQDSVRLYFLHALALVLSRQSHMVEYLWERSPEFVKDPPNAYSSLCAAIQSLQHDRYDEFYGLLRSFTWPPDVSDLIAILQDTISQRNYEHMLQCYSNVHIVKAAQLLGLSPDQCRDHLLQQGARLHANKEFLDLTSIPPQSDPDQTLGDAEIAEQVRRLGELAIKFE